MIHNLSRIDMHNITSLKSFIQNKIYTSWKKNVLSLYTLYYACDDVNYKQLVSTHFNI